MGSTAEHTELVNQTLLALGSRADIGKFWKRNTGAIQAETGAYIRYGVVGGADIEGILVDGIHCELEAKTGKAKQSQEQKNFQAMISKYGGVYIVFRDTMTVLTELEQLVCS